jgi:tRNA (mo5U34)-methyltransferase
VEPQQEDRVVDLAAVLRECPEWFHSIELAPNVFTPGRKSAAVLAEEWRKMELPDLRGKSVLDIGAYDGYFSFAAEKAGAARVVALDRYVWSVDMAGYMADWRRSRSTGESLPPPHESRHHRPGELPGRKPFDAARRILGSKVEPVVGDFMSMDLSTLGTFDVVLFLGVLYHLEEPLLAARKLRTVTAPGGLLVLETEAMEIRGVEDRPICEFFPGQELNNDASNWWSPNAKAIEGLCHAAGFENARVWNAKAPSLSARLARAVPALVPGSLTPKRYRAYAHAR